MNSAGITTFEIKSGYGLTTVGTFARVTVVVMRSFSMTLVTRLRSVARRCAGWRPSFDP